ncbi:methyltransferase-like protein 22 isoform X4 [Rhinolophus ferrumequinum]|uniref:methyltransferase-like protein 22 isoform X4 n=1 Tax=Rhinolophus ferrumequinum TaxID=59479 RepID=UPI00140FBEEB|nr:methyltransferase-like protein 22 isoform X4 [Rhinolophus ferrumequinum]
MINVEPRSWWQAPVLAMEEVTFKSDTVLSDIHLCTPNQRHLMVRLNGVGQPVFLSQFKFVWNQDSQTDSGAEGGDHGDVPTEETPAGIGSTGSPPGSGGSSEGFFLQASTDSTSQEWLGAHLDEDGDLDVVRRPRAASNPKPAGPPRDKVHPMILMQEEDDILGDEAQEGSTRDVIKIEHTMATPLEDVGKQVWRGALFLADYILFQWDLFQGCTVLELGAGTGLASIVAATVAQTVYCTGVNAGIKVSSCWRFVACPSVIPDVGADLLAMCQRNVALNSHLTASGGEAQQVFRLGGRYLCLADGTNTQDHKPGRRGSACFPLYPGGVVKVRELDWLKDDLCTDPDVLFSWSEEDISDLYNHTTILLAAEVFYDDDLTDALFKTLCRLAHKLKNSCTAILSVEKRLNFTLSHLDVTCEAYDHFRSSLYRLEKLEDCQLRFAVEPVEASFPQHLVYERIQQLDPDSCAGGGRTLPPFRLPPPAGGGGPWRARLLAAA